MALAATARARLRYAGRAGRPRKWGGPHLRTVRWVRGKATDPRSDPIRGRGQGSRDDERPAGGSAWTACRVLHHTRELAVHCVAAAHLHLGCHILLRLPGMQLRDYAPACVDPINKIFVARSIAVQAGSGATGGFVCSSRLLAPTTRIRATHSWWWAWRRWCPRGARERGRPRGGGSEPSTWTTRSGLPLHGALMVRVGHCAAQHGARAAGCAQGDRCGRGW